MRRQNHSDLIPPKVKSLFCQRKIKDVISKGGSEFIVPMHLEILNIYPIEDGIIIKVFHNKDILHFDPNTNIKKMMQEVTYSYFTLTSHPLDDIYPLAYKDGQKLVGTHVDILFCSYKIPIVVVYNKKSKVVSFTLIKNSMDEQIKGLNVGEDDEYIADLEFRNRNPLLYNISCKSKFYLEDVFSMNVQSPPSKVVLQKGLINPYELVFCLFFNMTNKLAFISTDIRNIKQFEVVKTLDNIQDINKQYFSRSKIGYSDQIKVIAKSFKDKIDQTDPMKLSNRSIEFKFMKKRIKLICKDLITLDQSGKYLTFYQGCSQISQIDILNQLEQKSQTNKEALVPRGAKIDSLEHSQKSYITLNFTNGHYKRMNFQFKITDFLVLSIIKCFKAFLPETTYESLISDIIETLTNHSTQIDEKKALTDIGCDQFTKVSNLLISLISTQESSTQYPQRDSNTNQQTGSRPSSSSGQNQQQRPATSLQTKILRSSTTSFAGGDSAGRKKAVNPGQQNQGNIQGMTFSTQQRPSQLRQQIAQNIQTSYQQRRVTSGSSEVQPIASTLSHGQYQPTSQNPFAELLNSNFHKENFNTNYKFLFSSDPNFQIVPNPSTQVQEALPVTQLLNSSPTKQSKTIAQSSKHQSTKAPIQHERKLSSSNNERTSITPVINYKSSRQDLLLNMSNIFSALHLLYEDLKLNKLREPTEGPKLAKLLIRMVLATEPIKKVGYLDYYLTDHPELRAQFDSEIKKFFKGDTLKRDQNLLDQVPRIYQWLNSLLQNSKSPFNQSFPLLFDQTRKVCRVYEVLSQSKVNSVISNLLSEPYMTEIEYTMFRNLNLGPYLNAIQENLQSITSINDYYLRGSFANLHLFEKILFCLKDENLSLEEIKKMPSVVSLPILEIIRYCRLFQQEIQSVPKWPDSLYKLIHREDILNNFKLFDQFSFNQPSASSHHLALHSQSSKGFALKRGLSNAFAGQSIEEQKIDEQRKEMENSILSMAADLMENNVQNLPDKSKQESDNYTDYLKNRFSQDTRFKEVCNILNSNSEMILKLEHIKDYETLPEEKLHQEKQQLLERLYLRQLSKCVGRGALGFGSIQTIPTETLFIPKINSTCYIPQTEQYMQIEMKDDVQKDQTQWPDFHNGVAAALRIAQSLKNRKNQSQSHTRNWIMYHKPNEPKYDHGGFILALGLLGQLASLQPTDIYQHLKSTHDATAIGILLGRAASKIGTMDDQDTRTLCIHIPYLLPPTLSIDISLSIQSAAVIGAGLVYKGTSNRLMTEMLLAQIGRKPLSDKAIEREGYALASGIALGLVNLGIGNQMQGISDLKLNERLIRFVEGGKTIDLPQSMLSTNFNHDNTKCSAIKEGDQVNVHITSPGALLALALIHLKSGNENIANKLQMPQTFYSLEYVRPSFLMLKVLCKNLIMWYQVEISKEWIFQQIPPLIKEIYESDISQVNKKFSQQISEDEIDYSTIALCYVNIVAGAIFSLGFRYAGTGNKDVFNLIQEFVTFFRSLKIVQPNKETIGQVHNNLTKNQIDKTTVETCLCVVAFAMSMVMAGTGDIECFRTLRVLRKRFEHDMHYGFNQSIHMSLGFLFLGSGAYTFSRSNLAIAALLCSLYPVFPSTPSDNRYHLQALRHFYVLAIETRLIQARDIDNGEFVNIDVEVEVETPESKQKIKNAQMQTPCIVEGILRKLEVKNEHYHYISLKMFEKSDQMEVDGGDFFSNRTVKDKQNLQKIIYVKKKTFIESQENLHEAQVKEVMQRVNSGDQNFKDLVKNSQKLLTNVKSIEDTSIKEFYNKFTNFDSISNEFPEVEDVMLSQTRDNFSSLGPQEFFKQLDLFQTLQQVYQEKLIPQAMKNKLQNLQTIYDCYKKDKLECTNALLDINKYSLTDCQQAKYVNELTLLTSYLNFIKNKAYINYEERQGCLISQKPINSNNQIQIPDKSFLFQETQLINEIENKHLQMLNAQEMQFVKIIVEQILNELKAQGEHKLVEEYVKIKMSKSGLQEGGPHQEINETIVLSLQQLFNDERMESAFISDILIPACFS